MTISSTVWWRGRTSTVPAAHRWERAVPGALFQQGGHRTLQLPALRQGTQPGGKRAPGPDRDGGV